MFTQEQIEEFIKCKDDPIYFINNYVKFDHFKDGLTGIKLYEAQEKLINKYHTNRLNICKGPRQVGKTLVGIFYILHHIIFNDNVTDGIFSHNTLTSRSSLERLQTAYENLPKWMQHKVIKLNRSTLELENGSRVIAGNTTYNSFKGWTFNLTYLDEFAFVPYEDGKRVVDTIFPIFTTNKFCKIIICSTPSYSYRLENILDEEGDIQTIKVPTPFKKIWKDSEDGKNSFVRTTIKWHEIPGRNEEWKERTIANIGIDAWNQQFECEFDETLDTTPQKLLEYSHAHKKIMTQQLSFEEFKTQFGSINDPIKKDLEIVWGSDFEKHSDEILQGYYDAYLKMGDITLSKLQKTINADKEAKNL